MIQRLYNEAEIYGSFDLVTWKQKASEARRLAIAARSQRKEHTFDSSIWSQLKPYLLAHFFDKCAYCELNITGGFWGDVEHYRPKKKVEEDPAHPGYYWLAYEPTNLMPSCQRCNQGKGKMNRFPVDAGTRAYDEHGIPAEQPLLLTPYFDNPRHHMKFDFDLKKGQPTGYVLGTTIQGRESIDIYGLNRTDLVDERLKAQRETLTKWLGLRLSYEAAVNEGEESTRVLEKFTQSLLEGSLAFTAARMGALKAWLDWSETRQRSLLKAIIEP